MSKKKYVEEVEEIDDKLFDDLQAEKRNNALIKELKKIGELIAESSDKAMIESITQQQEKIVLLINSLKKDEKGVKTQESFVSLTEKIRDEIIESNTKLIEAIENRDLPVSFDLVKNSFGVTQSVNVKYQKAKNI